MPQTNKKRTFWGHSFADYAKMFDLSDDDLNKKIVDIRGGPSSFNAEMHNQDREIISCDGLYSATAQQLTEEINDRLIDTAALKPDYQRFKAEQQKNIGTFLADYAAGKAEKRYLADQLPQLPFKDHQFDLALLHHALFDNKDLTPQGAMEALTEMSRVAHEVRIFPLLDNAGENSPLLGPVMLMLQQNEFGVEIKQVDFEIQARGNAMLRVWPLICEMH